MSDTTQKPPYSPEDLLQMAEALVMLQEGVSAFPDVNNGRITGLYLVDIFSAAVWCSKHGIEYEQEHTDKLKGGYPSLVSALAAAYDVLHPGEDPDVVAIPIEDAVTACGAMNAIIEELPPEKDAPEAHHQEFTKMKATFSRMNALVGGEEMNTKS